MSGWLVDPATRVLTAALTGLSKREEAIGSNLANIDTPGYRPRSVDFESALQEAMAMQADGVGVTGAGGMRAPETGLPGVPGSVLSAASGLARTDPRHLTGVPMTASGGPSIGEFDANLRNDTNTVDLESEVTALAESQLKYASIARLMSGKLGMLRDVASGGR